MAADIDYKKRMPYLFKKGTKIGYSPAGVPYNESVPIFNRKMQLVIPTHQRPERQFTLNSLRKDLQSEVLLVTSTLEDAKAIRKNYKELIEPEQVYAINDPSVNSIAKKRQWLIENLGSTSVFQMDDDMYFFMRCEEKYRKLKYLNPSSASWILKPEFKDKEIDGQPLKLLGVFNLSDEALVQGFRMMQECMTRKENRFVHVGLSSRMGNNQEDEEWKRSTRMMHAIGHRRDALIHNNVRFDEIVLREDFNVTLRLLTLGYDNIVYYTMCCSPSDYGAKGGCFDERSLELANSQAVLLSKMYPGLVTATDKKYEFSGDRKEVHIMWAKALELGIERKKIQAKKSLF